MKYSAHYINVLYCKYKIYPSDYILHQSRHLYARPDTVTDGHNSGYLAKITIYKRGKKN
jgi:hypothetical protein